MRYCEVCRETVRADCDSCEWRRPEVVSGNRAVLDLWTHAQGQWRTGLGGLVGLDLPAVFSVAQVLGIPINPPLLHKLRMIENAALAAQAKKTPTREV